MGNSTKESDKVLDLFGGSGSTLIACEELDRQCYMLELDPEYCKVIIERWETLTGKKAVLCEKLSKRLYNEINFIFTGSYKLNAK